VHGFDVNSIKKYFLKGSLSIKIVNEQPFMAIGDTNTQTAQISVRDLNIN
jgi:hypothetical protein